MLARTLTALALAIFLPALLRADDAPKGDKDLDGDWQLVSRTDDGKERAVPDDSTFVWNIKGEAMTVSFGGQSFKATLKLGAGKEYKTMDTTVEAIAERGPALAIYEIKDGVLRICEADPGKDRPTAFSSKQDSNWKLLTFKRVKN